MAETRTETVTILEVKTIDAVKNIGDLQTNIKNLKSNLKDLDIGTQEYQDTLNELKVNQNALKDAMYATSTSMEDVTAAATGTSESYNSLVHRMAALKEEFRATGDAARRADLGTQINAINDQLKEWDALQGNFQRNVGNYTGALDGFAEKLSHMPPLLGSTKEQIEKVGQTLQFVGKQPILGIIGLLAPIIVKITDSLKENETAMGAVKKMMEALQPVFNVVEAVIQKIADLLSDAVDWFVRLAGQSGGTFKNIIAGAVGVGNALLQYFLTPIKTIVESVKGLGQVFKDIFSGNFKSIAADAKVALSGIQDAFTKGVAFKTNFETGKTIGEQFLAGLGDAEVKQKAKDTGKALADKVAEGYTEELDLTEDPILAEMEAMTAKMVETTVKGQEEARQARKDAQARMLSDLTEFAEEQVSVYEQEVEREKALAKQRVELQQTVASASSSILSSLADMYEANSEESEKNAEKVKGIRIASTIIDTISGAMGAFATAAENPGGIPGMIIGAANAAVITAAGLAAVAQIRSTSASSASGASGASSGISATQSAPSVPTSVSQVRSVTSASEEERLNQIASDQKVYILSSDIEASQNQRKVQVAESSF